MRLVGFACACLVVLAALPAAAAEPVDPAAVDAVVQEALKAWGVPGAAVAVVRGDEVVYLHGHGVKELGRKDSVTPDTVFPIASCTKGFTTTAMAMLVDDGKLAWDDPVRRHVPYFHLSDPLVDGSVTLRDLVCHRTGVRGHDLLWYHSPWSQEEIIRRIGLVKVDRPFRSSFNYQSTMFVVAGHALGRASGMGWGDFVRRRLLDPLEMKATVLTSPEAEAAADHASPHRKNRLGRPEVIPYYRIETPEPAGSVYSTARDLATWARFQLGDGTFAGKRLVSAAALAETHTPQSTIRLEGSARTLNPETIQLNYGMGWVVQDYRGRLLVAHAGAIDGFRAHITLVPDAKLGIVLLNNLHETRMNLALSNNLVDLFLGLGKRDWNAYYLEQVHKDEAAAQERVRQRLAERHHDTHPSREASAYVGRYEDPAYGSAEVTFEDGTLVWQWSTFRCPLRHFHYDTFMVENDVLGHPLAFFTLAADGEVASIKVGDMLEVEFKKVKPKSPRGSP